MDLISRKAAIDRLNAIPPGNWSKTRYTRELWNVPSVPDVPLDKLCELLSKGAYPCTILSASLCPLKECIATSRYSNNVSKACWRAVLEKMMEEQDAVDRRS